MFICCNMLDFVFGGYDFITSYVHKKMTNTLLVSNKITGGHMPSTIFIVAI